MSPLTKPASSVAVLISGAMVACGLFAVAASLTFSGRYQLAGLPSGIGRIDTITGQMSFCYGNGSDKGPWCTPWALRTKAEFTLDAQHASELEMKARIEQAMKDEEAADMASKASQPQRQRNSEPHLSAPN